MSIAKADEKVPVEFPFKNTGTTTESIISVDADCGCVTIDDRKQNDFAPGESGKIVAHVEVRKKHGITEKHISLLTTDHPNKPTLLTARVAVLPSAEINPTELVWTQSEAAEAKEATFTLREKLQLRLPPLPALTSEALEVDLLPANDTAGPRLRVRPRKSGASGLYTLFVEATGGEADFSLALVVRLGGERQDPARGQ